MHLSKSHADSFLPMVNISVELEEDISDLKEDIGATISLDFSKIMKAVFTLAVFLVEPGFARFVGAKKEDVVADELIVLLSAARHLDYPLGEYVWDALDSTP
ncbi:hypothetical protein ACEPAH_2111 [Sanghuangporus vaninii]